MDQGEASPSLPPEWPADLDAIVLPGLPDREVEGLQSGELAFPATSSDVIKLLGESGLRVDYESSAQGRQAFISQWSAEFLLPILAFTMDALANGAGDLLADIIRNRIGFNRLRRTRLRVKVAKVNRQDMSATWFEGDGNADEVLEAMRRALRG